MGWCFVTLDLILLAQFQLPIQLRPVARQNLNPQPSSHWDLFLFDPNFPWSPLAAILTDTLIENFLSMSGTWGVSPYWFLGKLWVLYIILYIVIFHPEIFCIESGGSVPSVLAIGYHIGQTYLYYFSNEEKKYPEFENVF